MINYTFLKSAYHCEFKFSKISRKFCKTKFVFKDNCANSVQKSMQNFFAKIVQFVSSC